MKTWRLGCEKKGLNFRFCKDDHMSFEPKILGILCNWCAYAGGDLAGVSRIQYPPNMRTVRVMCTGRVDPVFIMEAFQKGCDGIWVGG